ncbi:dTDP-4-dehydrorhamnose reductase [Thalassoglobus sp. JC818]|uniref:dTDP-4-dehydrorhamnose reductase n=1 Tax=Thalassoglobus sp. JC818 TaxID=3232136 RepID=UPI0034578520
MSVVVFGCRGQLGTELCEQLGTNAVGFGHSEVNISNSDAVAECLDSVRPSVVINAAAYNKVDLAEDEPEVAYHGNAIGPRVLAIECAARNLPFVHVSSDYVFGGRTESKAWTEEDLPFPNSAYSTSKLAGEFFVRSLCPKHFVVRTCGLYGKAARAGAGKGNFVETMLRLGQEREELRVVVDQNCTPTSAADLASWIIALSETSNYGLYHGTNSGATTWADFATEIFSFYGLSTKVIPIPSSEYPTKAARPHQSILNSHALSQAIGQELRPWQTALADYLEVRKLELASA